MLVVCLMLSIIHFAYFGIVRQDGRLGVKKAFLIRDKSRRVLLCCVGGIRKHTTDSGQVGLFPLMLTVQYLASHNTDTRERICMNTSLQYQRIIPWILSFHYFGGIYATAPKHHFQPRRTSSPTSTCSCSHDHVSRWRCIQRFLTSCSPDVLKISLQPWQGRLGPRGACTCRPE